jgi:hypothetical protein
MGEDNSGIAHAAGENQARTPAGGVPEWRSAQPYEAPLSTRVIFFASPAQCPTYPWVFGIAAESEMRRNRRANQIRQVFDETCLALFGFVLTGQFPQGGGPVHEAGTFRQYTVTGQKLRQCRIATLKKFHHGIDKSK